MVGRTPRVIHLDKDRHVHESRLEARFNRQTTARRVVEHEPVDGRTWAARFPVDSVNAERALVTGGSRTRRNELMDALRQRGLLVGWKGAVRRIQAMTVTSEDQSYPHVSEAVAQLLPTVQLAGGLRRPEPWVTCALAARLGAERSLARCRGCHRCRPGLRPERLDEATGARGARPTP